ncbi:chemotaxis-specific protein-glutamate methyltransferase CheB [Roseomonas sp. CECT 9278]|uniref:chemotaxis-specific protein-glutamate methyltransferase CheB n=1 Tax=Roseomonas sp. CECT 9278 TaxID=2845823 RepID=UPI001E43F59D|nr:chemotaxis-specific protein-glutamate methyltransferase CheB [Roseomonas sp. CECT 9278]CAH0285220.1 Protein-glutamate methylesterase/protein-glutamine glutaminase [Roseomonas sp. CECT 9278]
MSQPQSDVRVMLCDDSATARAILRRLLEAEPGIRVVHQAADGRAALDALPTARPDVVLLDLEMPVMDGMTALPLILKAAPQAAVIVASALTQRGAKAAIAALAAGAADYVPKPQGAAGGAADPAFKAELIAKVRGWARMKRQGSAPVARPAAPPPRAASAGKFRPSLVAIGSSTGGPQALAAVVKRLPRLPVPIVVVQHMPAGFTTMLAEHLDKMGPHRCAEAVEGEPLLPGRIHLAPGDRHLLLEAAAGGLRARLSSGPPENFCRPAVDPMLRSAVAALGGRLLAVILTGMGHDGLEGCRGVVAAGGTVLAQDEASSVVWGMPGAVARAGLAGLLAPPEALAERIAALAAERVTA